MLKRSELRPGMKVYNKVSKQIGEVRGDPDKPKQLCRAHKDFLAVRLRGGFGDYFQYPTWWLKNLTLA